MRRAGQAAALSESRVRVPDVCAGRACGAVGPLGQRRAGNGGPGPPTRMRSPWRRGGRAGVCELEAGSNLAAQAGFRSIAFGRIFSWGPGTT